MPAAWFAKAGLADCWCIIGAVECGIIVRIDRLMDRTTTRRAAESANQTLLVQNRWRSIPCMSVTSHYCTVHNPPPPHHQQVPALMYTGELTKYAIRHTIQILILLRTKT